MSNKENGTPQNTQSRPTKPVEIQFNANAAKVIDNEMEKVQMPNLRAKIKENIIKVLEKYIREHIQNLIEEKNRKSDIQHHTSLDEKKPIIIT